jgi:hypothetical protein
LQDKLAGNQPLTPEHAEEIAKTMDRTDVPPGSPPTLVIPTRAVRSKMTPQPRLKISTILFKSD